MRLAAALAVACGVACGGRDPWSVEPRAAALQDGAAPPLARAIAGAEPAGPLPVALPEDLTLAFVGDVMLGRYRHDGFDPVAEDGAPLFDEVRPLLSADVVIGNLETPLVRVFPLRSPIGGPFRFGASVSHARSLLPAGFTALSVANNHWFDQLAVGVVETPGVLRELGIVPLGVPGPTGPAVRVETLYARGWRLGIVALTTRANRPPAGDGPPLAYVELGDVASIVAPLLEGARTTHDLLVVFVHWGDERSDTPDRLQVRAGRALVDAGADLVIGHHPHVLQGIERRGDALIAYSLGNFVFDSTFWDTRQTGVLRVRAATRAPRLREVLFEPAFLRRTPVPHPVPARGAMGEEIRARVARLSAALDTRGCVRGEGLAFVDASAACGDGSAVAGLR